MRGIAPFTAHAPQGVLDDLHERLSRVRLPDQLPDAGWDYGTERSYLQTVCDYWRDGYDWRATEARFNGFGQHLTTIDGETVHFLHVRSPNPDALPLILTHGWPGSVAEFLEVLGPLADPPAHGGDPADAFHVVAPSIPGYGYSGPTQTRGFTARRAAQMWAELMERLGYHRYGAQGGDWGAIISTHLAAACPERLVGLHLNLIIGRPADPEAPLAGLTPQEAEDVARTRAFNIDGVGYQRIQETRPQTLAYGLTDSPAGLAAWILEKFRAWSDCGGDLSAIYPMDRLLDNIMLYWVTGTINSSMRLYYESNGPGRQTPYPARIGTPTGHALFPAEIVRTPRPWAEQVYNIVRWTRMPRGGHFAAMEQPALFVDEVREFFRPLRGTTA